MTEIAFIIYVTLFFSAPFNEVYGSVSTPSSTVQAAQTAQPQALQPQAQSPQVAITVVPPAEQPIPSKIVSGKPEYTINASLPLKGETGILGNHIFDGMSLFFNKVKQEITNTPLLIALNALDDRGEVPSLRANVRSQERFSPIFLSLLGTQSLVGLKRNIRNGDMLALFPLDGALQNRSESMKHTLFFRDTFEQEIDALVQYAIDHLDRKKIGMFYEASDWGEAALSCAKKVFEKHGIQLHAVASYPQRSLVVKPAIDEITKKAPTAIICFAGARPAYNFIRGIINNGLHKTIILGPSNLFSIQETLGRSRGVGIVTSMVVPDPEKSDLQIAQEYRADLKRYFSNKKPNPFSFEGYINAALLYEALKGIQPPITINKIMALFQGIKTMNFKGLELNYDSSTRSLYHKVTINDETNLSSKVAAKSDKPAVEKK